METKEGTVYMQPRTMGAGCGSVVLSLDSVRVARRRGGPGQ